VRISFCESGDELRQGGAQGLKHSLHGGGRGERVGSTGTTTSGSFHQSAPLRVGLVASA
jgi:hypothetical protein